VLFCFWKIRAGFRPSIIRDETGPSTNEWCQASAKKVCVSVVQPAMSRAWIGHRSVDEKAGGNQLLAVVLNRGDQSRGDSLTNLRILARHSIPETDAEARPSGDLDGSGYRLPRERSDEGRG
jgi:hypothetical protein